MTIPSVPSAPMNRRLRSGPTDDFLRVAIERISDELRKEEREQRTLLAASS